jgi:hypothetical protein
MRSIYSDQEPIFDSPGIFLAGPTPRTDQVVSWRIQALLDAELKEVIR